MPILDQPEGALYYDLTDIAPSWVGARETILFLHGLAIDSDIWVTWLPALADRYRIVRVDRCHVSMTLSHRDVDGATAPRRVSGESQARRALWRAPEHATRARPAPEGVSMIGFDHRDLVLDMRLREITTPTLIIAPDDSPFVSVESAVERMRAMPNARLQVMANARHGVAFSHGPECAGVLRRHLNMRAEQ